MVRIEVRWGRLAAHSAISLHAGFGWYSFEIEMSLALPFFCTWAKCKGDKLDQPSPKLVDWAILWCWVISKVCSLGGSLSVTWKFWWSCIYLVLSVFPNRCTILEDGLRFDAAENLFAERYHLAPVCGEGSTWPIACYQPARSLVGYISLSCSAR